MISRRNFLQAAGAMAAAPTLLLDNAAAVQAVVTPDPYQQLVLFMRKLRELELLYGRRAGLTAKREESFKQSLLNDDNFDTVKRMIPKFVADLYQTQRAIMDLYENGLGTGLASFTTLYTACGLLQYIKTEQRVDGAKTSNALNVDTRIRRVIRDLLNDKFIREIETTEDAFQYRTTEKGDILYSLLAEIVGNLATETKETKRAKLQPKHLVPKITAFLPKLTELDGLALLKQIQEELENNKSFLPD